MFKMREKMITAGLLGTAALLPVDFVMADQIGPASWYSLPQNRTANGEQMNPNDLTAAHRSLPFGTRVLVENLSNGRSVVVRINDRGPFTGGRIIDLSRAAAADIGMINSGVAKVRVSTTDGGALADLGDSKTKAAKAAQPKAGGSSVAAAPAKSSKGTSTKVKSVTAKPAKARTATVSKKAAPSKKRASSQATAAAKRSKASLDNAAPIHHAASINRIRAAAQQPAQAKTPKLAKTARTPQKGEAG